MKLKKQTPTRTLLLGGAIVTLALCPLSATAQEYDAQASLEEATAIAEQLLERRQSPVQTALNEVRAAQFAVEAVTRSSGAETPAAIGRYSASVQALAKTPVPETLNALATAMTHPNVEVRLASVVALREGASSRNPHSTALLQARTLVLADPSSSVRRQAFEAYSRWGQQSDVLDLAKTLGRTPGPVRDLAVREWIRIEQEQSGGKR